MESGTASTKSGSSASKADPNNWLVVPSLRVRPTPPYDGFWGFIGDTRHGQSEELRRTAYEMLRSARGAIGAVFGDLPELKRTLQEAPESPNDEEEAKDVAASCYQLLVVSLTAMLTAGTPQLALENALSAARALARLTRWQSELTSRTNRRHAKGRRPRNVYDAAMTPEAVAAFARDRGYRPRGGLRYEDFVRDAAKHFKVKESLIKRRFSEAKRAGLVS